MTAARWKKLIREQTGKVGTYKPNVIKLRKKSIVTGIENAPVTILMKKI